MKHTLIILLLLLQIGCSNSSSDDSSNILAGVWVSNCYELTDESSGLLIAYVIDKLNISDDLYLLNSARYTDVNCTMADGKTKTSGAEYTLGEQVITTDGDKAQRITLGTKVDFFGTPGTRINEDIFRVTGVELNFGRFVATETPSLDYLITYIKQ